MTAGVCVYNDAYTWLLPQVAALVAMLCGDEAKQITGSALVIDGGGLAQ